MAEIIVLDQFSRNMFRGSPKAIAQDSMALTLAQEVISRGMDLQLPIVERGFMYLPYMHSESLLIQVAAEKGHILDAEDRIDEWVVDRLALHNDPG